MEKISYLGLPNCYRLSNGEVELIVTTDAGPRIIHYGFVGAENMLGEVPEAVIRTELGEWKPLGGHRLWTAPEALPRSYAPDNERVEFAADGERSIHLRQRVEEATGIRKEMSLALDEEGTRLVVRHRLTNRNLWQIEVAPWALTIMRGGGEVILPQEPFRSWEETVLPARPLILWHYTDLTDPRWTLGRKFIRLRTDESLSTPQKIGLLNKQHWAAYAHATSLFVKTVPYTEGASYPDYGCNNETYTAGSFMELETLGHLQKLAPGESATHVEEWFLFRDFTTGRDEDELAATLAPLIARVGEPRA